MEVARILGIVLIVAIALIGGVLFVGASALQRDIEAESDATGEGGSEQG